MGRVHLASAVLCLASALVLGCATPPATAPPADAASAATSAPAGGRPIGRSRRIRSGRLSHSLDRIERLEEGRVRVDLRLLNGSHRHYDALMLRVTLVGPVDERRATRAPVGSLRDGASRALSAHFDDVPFPIEEVLVSLEWAVP